MNPQPHRQADWISKPTSNSVRTELLIKLFASISYVFIWLQSFKFAFPALTALIGCYTFLLLYRRRRKSNLVTRYQIGSENELTFFTTVRFRLGDFPYAQDQGFLTLMPEHYLFEGEHIFLSGPLCRGRLKRDINFLELTFARTTIYARFSSWRFLLPFQGKALRLLLKNVSGNASGQQVELYPPLLKTPIILMSALNKCLCWGLFFLTFWLFGPEILRGQLPPGSEAINMILGIGSVVSVAAALFSILSFVRSYRLLTQGINSPSSIISSEPNPMDVPLEEEFVEESHR